MFFVMASAWGGPFFLGPSPVVAQWALDFVVLHGCIKSISTSATCRKIISWAPSCIILILQTSSYDDDNDHLPRGPNFIHRHVYLWIFFSLTCTPRHWICSNFVRYVNSILTLDFVYRRKIATWLIIF